MAITLRNRRSLPIALLLACAPWNAAAAQFGTREAVGEFYRVSAPPTAQRTFAEVEIERVAPGALTMPAPIAPLRLGTPLQAFTGLIEERPERQRFYFTGIDSRGVVHLFEVDLISRQTREVAPSFGPTAPVAVEFLVTPQAEKLYVSWYRAAMAPETDIYDGATLGWLDRTLEFSPDPRAAGFESVEPHMWTLDRAGRPLLIDTNSDRVVGRFDLDRWFGPGRGVTEDAWRDQLLVHLDAGHDRFQVVDVVSGEVGPPLDLDGYAQAEARLVLAGRALALVDIERRARYRGRRDLVAIATGAGSIYDLRQGARTAEFRLAVPFDLPSPALGTTVDPTVPGRLWVHAPNDDERFDFDLPACQRQAPRGDRVAAQLDVELDASGNRPAYRYRISVSSDGGSAAGALAIQAGTSTERSEKPAGWGVDLIARDRWVRWTNGLGPAEEDVRPGQSLDGFAVHARGDTRPGIGEYRIQAATGLPRGCESDDDFLRNSAKGYTVVPERVEVRDAGRLADRLAKLVERACEIGWATSEACPALRTAARAVAQPHGDAGTAVARFIDEARAHSLQPPGGIVLVDAARAVAEAAAGARP